MIITTTIETEPGNMIAAATDEGICLLEFSDRKILNSELNYLAKYFNTIIKEGDNSHLKDLRIQLKEYFGGSRKDFSIPIITPGSDFQNDVWRELMNIPFGTTRSYHEQSVSMGRPRSIRAIANANGKNRISIIIPCHRVIGTDGTLTGYGGGLNRKKWLINHEKIHSGKPAELTLF